MPFTVDEFLNIFRNYNLSLFPAQIILNLLAVLCILFLFKDYRYSSRYINLILSFLWLWTGVLYHILFFSAINPAAYLFGTLFIFQAALFLFLGIGNVNQYKVTSGTAGVTSMIIIGFALIIYPLLGYIFGHVYPSSPTFGLPCPTVIFTFGILLLSTPALNPKFFFIPFLWSLLGFSAAVSLGIWEDIGLLITGVAVTVFLTYNYYVKHRPKIKLT